MSQEYTTVSCDTDSLRYIGDDATADAVDQLVTDINTLYYDMYKVGVSQGALDVTLDEMGAQASGPDAWTGSVWITMIKALTIECNSVAGALCCITDTMNIIDDLMNVMTTSQNAYDRLVDNCTNDPSKSGVYFTGTSSELPQAYYDMLTFNDTINVFTNMEFTITSPEGTTTCNGVLNVLSTEGYWSGHPPMDTQTAELIETSIEGITGQFSSWASTPIDSTNYQIYKSEFDQIYYWSQPIYTDSNGNPTTNPSGTDGIATTSSQNSEINDDMNAVVDQLQAATTTEQTYLSQGMTFYQQVQSEEEEDIQMLSDWNTYIISHTGG